MSNNHQQSAQEKYIFCTTQLKTTNHNIDNFSHRQKKCGECIQSEDFISTAPNGRLLKWRMRMFPNGEIEQFKDYISLYLNLINSNNNEEVEAKPQYTIRKSNGSEFMLQPMPKVSLKFDRLHASWGFNRLIKRENLFDEINGYLVGDRLTIVCKLIVLQESVHSFDVGRAHAQLPECQALEDLSHLFEKSIFTDCKIISEDKKEYKAHKCILSCRSPVFGAMFEHEMLERNSNIVDIEDMQGNVVEEMLRFIYSGKEPYLLNEMAEDLLMAAEKYELIRLKLLCERKLINSMGSANACKLLLLADLYSAENLKVQAINFIKMNMNEVKKSRGWKLLLAEADEKLMEQILVAMCN